MIPVCYVKTRSNRLTLTWPQQLAKKMFKSCPKSSEKCLQQSKSTTSVTRSWLHRLKCSKVTSWQTTCFRKRQACCPLKSFVSSIKSSLRSLTTQSSRFCSARSHETGKLLCSSVALCKSTIRSQGNKSLSWSAPLPARLALLTVRIYLSCSKVNLKSTSAQSKVSARHFWIARCKWGEVISL